MSAETVEAKRLPSTGAAAAKDIRTAFSSKWASIFIIAFTVVWTVPTVGLLVTSLRPGKYVANSGWWTVVEHPHFTLSNYNTVLFGKGATTAIFPYVMNSIAITIPATLITLAIATMAAYGLAWVKFKGSDTVFFIIFALQVVPLQMSLIPLLRFYNLGVHIGSVPIFPALHLGGKYYPVWVSHTMFGLPLAVFLLHNFISQLPEDMMEAARVDGANHFRIFRQIVLPLSTPAIAAFAIFQFLWVWNDLLVALTFAGGRPNVLPLTGRLEQLVGQYGANWQLLTAGAFIALIIPLIVFFSLQRYFVRGLLAGSVKG
ncbi:MAG TPA: carbohydrate ABC transporter permease [Acidothermaceae bacterium]